MNKDNEQYAPVIVTTPIPDGHLEMCLICQIVGWNGEEDSDEISDFYAYAYFIASSIVFSGANYSDWYIADYPKQAARMKKIVRDGYEVVMETLPHDPSNWREAFVKMLKQLKSYGWEIFKGKVAFDLDKAIKDVENLLKK